MHGESEKKRKWNRKRIGKNMRKGGGGIEDTQILIWFSRNIQF